MFRAARQRARKYHANAGDLTKESSAVVMDFAQHRTAELVAEIDVDDRRTRVDALQRNLCVDEVGVFGADEETEMLTSRGWLRYDEVTTEDEAYALNHDTGSAQWERILAVNVFVAPPAMLRMEGRGHSSLTTMNHRWPVLSRGSNPARRVRFLHRKWKTSGTLNTADSILRAAPRGDSPAVAKYTDCFVALMAWFWTEGCINGSGAISICQSLEVNPQNCADIRTALTRHLGPAFDGDMRGIKGPETLTDRHVAAWKESLHKGSEVIYFFLNKAASRPLLDHVDSEKKVSLGFLRDLTDAQLLLYVDVSMRADGNPAKLRLAQTSKARAEAFQYAAILAGYATTIHHVDNDHHSSAPESRHRDQWEVGLIRSGRVSPVAHATNKDGRPFAVEQTTYDGQVWCPTVPSGTWLARRNGTVYWTGDTDGTAWSRRDSPS